MQQAITAVCLAMLSLSAYSQGMDDRGIQMLNDYEYVQLTSAVVDSNTSSNAYRVQDYAWTLSYASVRNGLLVQEYPLNNLASVGELSHFGWVESLSVHAVDSATLYIYGLEMGYGAFPFMIRSTDAGQSWEPVLFTSSGDRIDNMAMRMRRNSLVMFNAQEGVLMYLKQQKNKAKLVVRYTSDAWSTYKEKTIDLGELSTSASYNIIYQHYADGVIELTFDNQPGLVFQSTDGARSFQKLLIEQAE